MTLPDAILRDPACGACGDELDAHGDGLACYSCCLVFDPDDLSASFLDQGAAPCGAPCDNFWHGDDKISPGLRFDCHPCQLPAGHSPGLHWRGCDQRADVTRSSDCD